MHGWAYFVGLLLCPTAVTALMVFTKREKGLGIPWLLAGLAACPFLHGAAISFTAHGCDAGQPPWTMAVLPLGSMVAALWLLRPRKVAVAVATVLAVANIAMTLSWITVVHESGWSGNPDTTHRQWMALEPWTMALEKNPAASTDETEYPEGWLDESSVVRKYPEEARALGPGGRATLALPHAEGHTVLSGLYAVRPTRVRWWYPGGVLRDAMHRVVGMPCD